MLRLDYEPPNSASDKKKKPPINHKQQQNQKLNKKLETVTKKMHNS